MKVVVDYTKCAGHGRCYVLAPQLFEDDVDGYGVVLGDGEVVAAVVEQARNAVNGCPEQAVSITD